MCRILPFWGSPSLISDGARRPWQHTAVEGLRGRGNTWLAGDPGGQDGADTTAGRRLRAGPCEGSRRECSLRSGVAVWGSRGAQGRGSSGLSGDHDEQKVGAWPNGVAGDAVRTADPVASDLPVFQKKPEIST